MATNEKILTQNDLLVLNAALEQIAANLKIHVNESLSVAHGMNAKVANYYDSFGDQFGNVVLIFESGTPPNVTRMFVPAQITNLGPASTNAGLISTGATAGSFSSPGIPLAHKPLVTDLTTESVTQALIYDNLLLSHVNTVHTDTGTEQCHGGETTTAISVLDSLGHTVGRYYITLGINGTAWKIPCDPYSNNGNYGPPQIPRIVPFAQTYYQFKSDSPNTALQFTPFKIIFTGSTPATIRWFISHDNATFVELTDPPYNAPPYSTGGASLDFPGWQSGVSYTLTDFVNTQDTLTIIGMSPDENTWRHLYFYATVTNTAGTATSATVQVDIYDKTGSWIVYAAHAVEPFTLREMKRLYKLRIWVRRNYKAHADFYLGAHGEELVSKMRANGFNFGTLTAEIRGFLADGIKEEQRFSMFRDMVVRNLALYWPGLPASLCGRRTQ